MIGGTKLNSVLESYWDIVSHTNINSMTINGNKLSFNFCSETHQLANKLVFCFSKIVVPTGFRIYVFIADLSAYTVSTV